MSWQMKLGPNLISASGMSSKVWKLPDHQEASKLCKFRRVWPKVNQARGAPWVGSYNEWIHQVWYRSLKWFVQKCACAETIKCGGRTDRQTHSYSPPPPPPPPPPPTHTHTHTHTHRCCTISLPLGDRQQGCVYRRTDRKTDGFQYALCLG